MLRMKYFFKILKQYPEQICYNVICCKYTPLPHWSGRTCVRPGFLGFSAVRCPSGAILSRPDTVRGKFQILYPSGGKSVPGRTRPGKIPDSIPVRWKITWKPVEKAI